MIFASCSERVDRESSLTDTIQEERITSESQVSVAEKVESDSIKIFGDPLDINALKKQSFLEITSGVLPKAESDMFYKPDEGGFFRFYYLIDKDYDDKPLFGKLKVYVPDEPGNWRADFENEYFAEIKLESDKVRLWNKLEVGTHINQLTEFVGERKHQITDSVFTADIGKYSLRAVIRRDTIKELSVGTYCK